MSRSLSLLSEAAAFGSPPSSPQRSLYSYAATVAADADLMDFPFLLPTPPSSPSSSPLSTDDSNDYVDQVSFQRHAAADSTPVPQPVPLWHDAAAPLSLDRPSPRLSSPPPANPSFRSVSVSSSAASTTSDSSHRATAASSRTQRKVRKRKRGGSSVNEEERLQRRREQHRAVDASRRQKENEAITRLHGLIRQQRHQRAVIGEVEDETGDGDEDEMEGGKHKAGRLTVLESSIALIEQLTAACKRMDAACNAKDVQVSRVSNQLHSVAGVIAQQVTSLALGGPVQDGFSTIDGMADAGTRSRHAEHFRQPWHPSRLPPNIQFTSFPVHPTSSLLSVLPPSTSSYLLQSDMSHTLRQYTTSLLSTMCMIVIALPGKIVIDVNERFVAMTGHPRSEMLYRPLNQASINRGVSQYPASMAAVDAVIVGSQRQGSATWRCRRADEVLYEIVTSFYALYNDARSDGSVDEKRRPDQLLIISAPDEVILVGETHAADVV